MLDTYEKHSNAKLVATIITVLVIAGVVVISDYVKAQKSPVATVQTSTSSAPSAATPTPTSDSSTGDSSDSSTPSTTSTGYADGTYSATSDYYVPHGEEEIEVNLTLKDGTITDVSVQNSANDFDSARYQQDFVAGYKSYVVGKSISGLSLSIISGASDTTQGFNDALSQIASKAQV